MKNRVAPLLAGLLSLISQPVLAQIPDKESLPAENRVLSPCPGEFPIVALGVADKNTGLRPGDLIGVKECGFNICMQSGVLDLQEKLVRSMEGTGLRLIPYSYSFSLDDKDDRWKGKMVTFVDKFRDNPSVAGWYFGDEPKWDDLPAYHERFDYLRHLDGKRFIFYNLVGQIAKQFTGPCKSMGEYADSVARYFDMDVWSSDIYPITYRNGKLKVNYKDYYANLRAFSDKMLETGIPMWSYCESLEYEVGSTRCPAPTVPYLSFEAFSALAYGAQGIVYYTYRVRPTVATSAYRNISALIDLEGNRSKGWYAAQKVNRQIRALTPVFLGARPVEVRHTGMIDMEGTYPYISDFGPLDELTGDVKGVLVSHLRNDGSDYLVLVNHDVEKKQKVRMRFKSNLTVTRMMASDEGDLSAKTVRNIGTVTLSPGGYAVFKCE